jgi:hypothetical protein
MSLKVINIESQLRNGFLNGGDMRDYTYIAGNRFGINNIFRSQRFDVDRLDINWTDDEKPEFVRGLRIIDHQEGETYTVHSEDADNLMYSLAYVSNKSKLEDGVKPFDEYLAAATSSKDYLVTAIKKKSEENAVVH